MPRKRSWNSATAVAGIAALAAFSTPVALAGDVDGTCVPGSSALSIMGSFSAPMLEGSPGTSMPLLEGPTEVVHLLTGAGSPQRTDDRWDVAGADLGVAFTDEAEQTYLAFGDTVSCQGPGDGWRSNTMMRTTDQDYGDGLQLSEALTHTGFQAEGPARQFIPSMQIPGVEYTTIPTAGISVDGSLYVDYVSVRSWGAPGEWITNYAATIESTDDGETWEMVPESVRVNENASAEVINELPGFWNPYRSGSDNLQMSALVHGHDDYVYRMSTPSGRTGNAVLSRIKSEDFPDESKFEYFDGSDWDSDRTEAASVLGGPVSELSLAYNDHLSKWTAMYFDGNGLVLRTADKLTGTWSEKNMLISTETVPDLYGGFLLPHNDGNHLHYVATTWSDYNVYLMRTDLNDMSRTTATDDGIEVVDEIDYSHRLPAEKLRQTPQQ